MKKGLLILLVGALLGIAGWNLYQRKYHPTLAQRASDVGDRTRDAAAQAGGKAASSAKEVGAELGDASIVARIKGKYFVDSELSALAISVECERGRVTLTGTAKSADLIQRAVRLARETGGVHDVTSKLTIRE